MRKNSARDRRCKTVHLQPRTERVINRINATALKLRHEFKALLTVSGIGQVLALTIMLETGSNSRS